MNKRVLWLPALVVLAIAAVACGQVPTSPPVPGEPTAVSSAAPVTAASTVPATAGSKPLAQWPAEAQPLVDLAIADLAGQVGVSTATARVVAFEAVQWPNSCLGCAKTGHACLDVMTPGYRIVLQVGNDEYEYHTDTKSTVVLCLIRKPAGNWGAAQPLVDQVVADLAGRLQITKDKITVVQVEAKTWPDSSIGCPQPGYVYTQVITPGYQITLEAAGKQYDYHTGSQTRFVLCEK